LTAHAKALAVLGVAGGGAVRGARLGEYDAIAVALGELALGERRSLSSEERSSTGKREEGGEGEAGGCHRGGRIGAK
jgi:hypothetical protein